MPVDTKKREVIKVVVYRVRTKLEIKWRCGMRVTDYLKEHGVDFETSEHRATFTAQEMAAEEHVPGRYVAKPVVVKADGQFYMAVLPACHKIDLDVLKSQLGAKDISLADEKELAGIFGDVALGAEPPLGNLYGLPTIMDESLEDDEMIVFQGGSHEEAVRISMADYLALVEPKILAFSYHMS
jgi:Ala-tRNA(Pro) deacylase